ncbi:hypothetical protein C4D60_Mb06t33820 [Musa balbisiana]|uniref:GST N-terminal domain-containing protein n=1 Tax=Musa balbisiana TaxID=52838 RepID=A0A4S8ISL1_MUSBA|nr:hypothetical protein C4D60_Mb06t33820 [Musa balbisiana]
MEAPANKRRKHSTHGSAQCHQHPQEWHSSSNSFPRASPPFNSVTWTASQDDGGHSKKKVGVTPPLTCSVSFRQCRGATIYYVQGRRGAQARLTSKYLGDPPMAAVAPSKLYVAYVCPFAQRPWIVRNYKGLQEKIELVPVDLLNRPAWYKEKLYSANKVPSLEHNSEVRGESLDLIKYIDAHFEGPALKPDDPAKQQFAEELLSYSDSFNMVMFQATAAKGDVGGELDAAYDKIEDALSKFSDGPFFLGQFSLIGVSSPQLYVAYVCPFAQRPWIVRNYKGLQEKIELVPVDLLNRPAWYKEKLYSANKVPSLEHNSEVRGESLDLIKYIDAHFEGPALKPDDPAKQQFAEELLSYSDSFNMVMFQATAAKGDVGGELDAAYDKIEDALSKFSDGPFFLGQFSLVDIAYAPFVERFQTLLLDVKNYDILKGRPKLALWIEELNKIEAYVQTRIDPQELLSATKKRWHEEYVFQFQIKQY